jgi:2-polyprenyl-3-methyl-5-hydroxy-6-metoxy-1,4-benzoquinol methylase
MPDAYSHGHHASVLRSHRWRTVENSAAYLVAHLRPGLDLLDVGCGPGTITLDLAGRVAPGRVVGIDAAADVIDQASEAAATAQSSVEFAVGDTYALEFEDASFDVVHGHQVLQHLADPVAALREWRRVCRPGGVVAARDADYEAMVWHPAEPGLDRWLDLYRRLARHNHGEPDAGRTLLAWAHAAGFDRVEATASVWCFATPEDREWWGGSWADRVTTSAFATQTVDAGLASPEELAELAAAWHRWRDAPDAWFAVLHGEIICHR